MGYLMKNLPPIISKSDGEFEYSRDKLLRELMDNADQQNIEHYLSMVFPDIRIDILPARSLTLTNEDSLKELARLSAD